MHSTYTLEAMHSIQFCFWIALLLACQWHWTLYYAVACDLASQQRLPRVSPMFLCMVSLPQEKEPAVQSQLCEYSLCCARRQLPHIPAAAELCSADVVAIADRLFAAEATWYRGSPLAQTVFTCLYLLQPHRHVAHLF